MATLFSTRAAPLPLPSGPVPDAGAADVAPPHYRLGFVLFLVLNATLFVRPAEIVPELLGWEIYLGLILVCFVVSFPAVLEQLSSRALERRPTTVCVLGILLAVVLADLSHFEFARAAEVGFDFFKVVVYYLLLVGLVNSPSRLRVFLLCLSLFAVVTVGLAVLQYHGAIHLPNLDSLAVREKDLASGDNYTMVRLRSTGVFNDPNDLCILIVASLLLSLHWVSDRRLGFLSLAWLGPLALFGYALVLTESRGGFLALLAGVLAFLYVRFGARAAVLLGATCLPVLFLFVSARQASLTTTAGTGQERIQLWSDGLMMFRTAPLFGIGKDVYHLEAGHVAHNAFLQCFAELGFFGGMMFLGAVTVPLLGLWKLGRCGRPILPAEHRRLHPYLTGVVAGYAAGMMSLSLSYMVPTYTILGAATAYLNQASVKPPLPAERFDPRLVQRLALWSVAFLTLMYVFVRVAMRR